VRLKEMAEEEGDDAAGVLKKIREMVGDVSFEMCSDVFTYLYDCIYVLTHVTCC